VPCTTAAAERELAALGRAGAELVAWGEPDYPAALAAVDDAPPLLSMRGNPALLQRPAIAVVGARNASANGRRFARDMALQLGGRGLVVEAALPPGPAELATAMSQLLEQLSPTPVPVDELIRQCRLPPAVVSAVLRDLELAGRLARQPGHQVALI
jgi:predicted Rossmann fold nucleotide-binding protein DprA/Smf involved in DNA uptake